MKKKVLVVEDNELNKKLFEYVLRSPELELFAARTGPEALSIIAYERPDLVILDIPLPGISGVDVAGRVRQGPEMNRGMEYRSFPCYSLAHKISFKYSLPKGRTLRYSLNGVNHDAAGIDGIKSKYSIGV